MTESLSAERVQELTELSRRLGVAFSNLTLLHQALTHTSYAYEAKTKKIIHNERLEFLGDAVLELASSTYLYAHFPKLPEGVLTKARASVVCEASLARRASELGLGDHLQLGHGEAAAGGAHRPSILADAFEAVIGAIYLDAGWQTALDYVLAQLKEELREIDRGQNLQDYKTLLQEYVQRKANQTIAYELISASGPDHAKVFELAVRINDVRCGVGMGKTKKQAEQLAAREALEKLKKK